MLAKLRLPGKQIADLPHHNRLFGGYIQNPVIVFQPGTALGLDHAYHAERFCNSAVVRRQEGAINACLLRARPWHTLRARGVIQMHVRVDNGHGISLGIRTCHGGGDRNRPFTRRLYEFASIHFGFLLGALRARIPFATILIFGTVRFATSRIITRSVPSQSSTVDYASPLRLAAFHLSLRPLRSDSIAM